MMSRYLSINIPLPTLQRLACILALWFVSIGVLAAATPTATQTLRQATLFSLSGDRPVTLPNVVAPEDIPLGGGRVRYRLDFLLPTKPTEPLGVFVPKLSLSGQVALNGQVFGACGFGPLENLRCLHQPQLFVPPIGLWRVGANTLEFEIYANDRQMNGLSPVQIGTAQALDQGPYLQQRLWQVELLRGLTWVVLSLGGLALAVAWILRSERLYLWFGLCSIANALSNLNVLVTAPPVSFELFSWFVFSVRLVSAPLFLLMLLAFFDRAGGALGRTLIGLALLMPLAIWVSGNNRWVVVALYLPVLVMGVGTILATIRWTWRSRQGVHATVTLTSIMLLITAVLDWLRLSGQSAFEGIYWSTYALTVVILVFGILLMSRLASALISERKLTALLGLAARAADAGFWDWDLTTNRVNWSKDMMSLFGMDPGAVGKDFDCWAAWRSTVHPDDLPRAEHEATTAARDRKPLALEYRIVRPDGDIRWIETRADISQDDKGRPLRLAGISLDVTRRKQAEIALANYRDQLEGLVAERTTELRAATTRLAEQERSQRLILENLPIPIVVARLSADAPVNFINKSFTATFGYTLAEVPTVRAWAEACDPDPAYPLALLARHALGEGLVAPESIGTWEGKVACQDGTRRDVVVTTQRLDDLAITSLIDITPRKRAEEVLIEAKQRAERLERAKGEFLANMSHDIRTPMSGVIGMTQLALQTATDARQRDYLQKIATSAKSLLGILNDILDFSKIEAGKLQIEQTPFELRPLIESVLHLIQIPAQDKGLELSVEYTSDLPDTYEGDPLRITQILTNLLSNAVKFTAGGAVRLSIWQPAPGRLRFAVRDTGIGMTDEERQRLFQSFSQADTSTTRKFGGTGLGLAISKRLVELMGGYIDVSSEPGHGSCFTFEIAARESLAPTPGPRVVDASPVPPVLTALEGKRLLLVEDNPINREIVMGLLEGSGLLIEVAEDGQQAVTRFQEAPYDLILMDVQMPVMDGYEASRRIRGLDPEVPIIGLTANAFQEDVDKALAAGMNEHLSKPIGLEQLQAVLQKYLTAMPYRASGQQSTPVSIPVAAPAPSDAFPHITGIDGDQAALMLGHNRALFFRILDRFADEYTAAAEQTARDLAQGERQCAARRMHSLRGVAAQLGALEIAVSAEDLEVAIQRGETALEAPLSVLDRQLRALLAASAPCLQSFAAESRSPMPASGLPPLDGADLASLREALRTQNLRALKRFGALQAALAGTLGKAKTEALGRAIHGMRFGEALALLDESAASDTGHTTGQVHTQ